LRFSLQAASPGTFGYILVCGYRFILRIDRVVFFFRIVEGHIFVMDIRFVFLEVGTKFLNII